MLSACSRVSCPTSTWKAHVRMDHARARRNGSEVRTRLGSQSLGPCQRLQSCVQARADVWTQPLLSGSTSHRAARETSRWVSRGRAHITTTSWVGLALWLVVRTARGPVEPWDPGPSATLCLLVWLPFPPAVPYIKCLYRLFIKLET